MASSRLVFPWAFSPIKTLIPGAGSPPVPGSYGNDLTEALENHRLLLVGRDNNLLDSDDIIARVKFLPGDHLTPHLPLTSCSLRNYLAAPQLG